MSKPLQIISVALSAVSVIAVIASLKKDNTISVTLEYPEETKAEETAVTTEEDVPAAVAAYIVSDDTALIAAYAEEETDEEVVDGGDLEVEVSSEDTMTSANEASEGWTKRY